jgi:uncharacterized protein
METIDLISALERAAAGEEVSVETAINAHWPSVGRDGDKKAEQSRRRLINYADDEDIRSRDLEYARSFREEMRWRADELKGLGAVSGDTPVPADQPSATRPPRVWKFWGTTLWGVLAFAAMSLGQLTVVAFEVMRSGEPIDLGLIVKAVSSGTTVALSVIMGLPAVCLALWLAIRIARNSFTDYLGLRGTSWKNALLGTVALVVLVGAWEVLAKLTGHKSAPGFMLDVVKSAQDDGTLWLLVIALTAGAAITEEILARGFLYRGWSESFLRPIGAMVLSSLVWTAMHAQYYDPFLFTQVFTMGLLFGYLRYRSASTWLTIYLHALNNLAATVQTLLIMKGVISP